MNLVTKKKRCLGLLRLIARRRLVAAIVCAPLAVAYGQGQDSTPYERDLQVISALLPGVYANANQAYFDQRGSREVRHQSARVEIERDDAGFRVVVSIDGGISREERWTLTAESDAVRMRMVVQGEDSAAAAANCAIDWQREAAQFRAMPTSDDCGENFATHLVLSERQLWMTFPNTPGADYQLHRARAFSCYADIPGVGGGRDEPFERYGEFSLHDQGGAAWFTSKEGRRLGISLFLVDWPINNYDGSFTRDSLVVYVNEDIDGTRQQHGYAFTPPEAERIGINLKWVLVNCYMESNAGIVPYM